MNEIWWRPVAGLLGLLVVALVAIGLITSFVVEGAKETKTNSSGAVMPDESVLVAQEDRQ